MNNKSILFIGFISLFVLAQPLLAQEPGSIKLPEPDTQGGKPFMQVLKDRKSSREFSDRQLSLQTLSGLLWAGFGVNRPQLKGRTAPSAMNCQEIDIYVAMNSGLYLYNPFNNMLELVVPQDIRAATGKQEFVKGAPVNLIFVLDMSRAKSFGNKAEFYAACDTGYISENVYLYCASSGLATLVRGMFDEKELSSSMKLRPDQKVILTQTVGYPK